MAKLYANENFPVQTVEELRRLGHDVLTTHESGKSNQGIDDGTVLQFAATEGRCVVTINRKDFIRLHRSGVNHAGIVVCTQDPDYAALAGRIHTAINDCVALNEQLIRVVRGNPSA